MHQEFLLGTQLDTFLIFIHLRPSEQEVILVNKQTRYVYKVNNNKCLCIGALLSQTNPQRTTTPICPLTRSSTRTRQLPLSPTTPQGNTLSHLYIHIFTPFPFLDCSPLWTLSPLTQTNPHPTLSSLLGTRDTCRSPLSTMYPWTVPLVLSPWPASQTTITTTTIIVTTVVTTSFKLRLDLCISLATIKWRRNVLYFILARMTVLLRVLTWLFVYLFVYLIWHILNDNTDRE